MKASTKRVVSTGIVLPIARIVVRITGQRRDGPLRVFAQYLTIERRESGAPTFARSNHETARCRPSIGRTSRDAPILARHTQERKAGWSNVELLVGFPRRPRRLPIALASDKARGNVSAKTNFLAMPRAFGRAPDHEMRQPSSVVSSLGMPMYARRSSYRCPGDGALRSAYTD